MMNPGYSGRVPFDPLRQFHSQLRQTRMSGSPYSNFYQPHSLQMSQQSPYGFHRGTGWANRFSRQGYHRPRFQVPMMSGPYNNTQQPIVAVERR